MTKLSSKYQTGEVATALVMEFFNAEDLREKPHRLAAKLVTHLHNNQFVIAPRPNAKPARRGKVKPAPYTGPEMIGKSHSARLAGN